MLLVKIDGKKHYENLEFEEEQVIRSLCLLFLFSYFHYLTALTLLLPK